jgi:hypothetical protein
MLAVRGEQPESLRARSGLLPQEGERQREDASKIHDAHAWLHASNVAFRKQMDTRTTWNYVPLLELVPFNDVVPRVPFSRHGELESSGFASGIGFARPTYSTSTCTIPEGRVAVASS